MKELVFITGSAIRRVYVDGKKITIISAEMNNAPYTIDLDKLDSKESRKKINGMKLTDEDKKIIRELAKLKDEGAIANDITRDFQSTGWRLIRRT